jgi:hypothetical protein
LTIETDDLNVPHRAEDLQAVIGMIQEALRECSTLDMSEMK